ncbi:hypothetical protein CK203_117330 [Vitis vinifera]|uniref:Uncharacterized protein n=1 Tax=Vitis vinifera TaxID=29760 RepID=A0A438C932_VITVI|nr:hypothetical protein CK203_117330 [Vitis vinifera]
MGRGRTGHLSPQVTWALWNMCHLKWGPPHPLGYFLDFPTLEFLSFFTSATSSLLSAVTDVWLDRRWMPWRPDSGAFLLLHFRDDDIPMVGLRVFKNVVRVLMGYSVLDMLFQLDISLLEVLFIYTRWRLRVGYISITLQEKVGHLVEWVEKDSFTRLNKLFKIDVSERNHNVLLSDKNLMVLINDPKPFIIHVFPHVAFPSLVASEHFVLKDLSFYEVVRLADLKARQTRLELWRKNVRKDI